MIHLTREQAQVVFGLLTDRIETLEKQLAREREPKRKGGVAGILSVDDNDVTRQMTEETFRAPRNLVSEPGFDANGSEVP
jgi:hypothetical protein